jgi:arylsulfatase A-like enzyme
LQAAGVTEPFCRRGDEASALATDWLARHGYLTGGAAKEPAGGARKPFFLWLHLFDPHAPYAPPAEHAALFPPLGPSQAEREVAAYDAEIHYADAQVGALLVRMARAGILDDTLVILTADHGEGLGEHGWQNHGPVLYEEAMRVPLVVRWPGTIAGGRTIEAPVALVDLPRTVLDLAGVATPLPGDEGRSLAPALRDGAALDAEHPVFLQRRRFRSKRTRGVRVRGEKLGVRVGQWKYVEAKDEGTRELYDLSRDPGELENLVDANPVEARRLADVLARWSAAAPAGRIRAAEVSPDDARRLRALGYVD